MNHGLNLVKVQRFIEVSQLPNYRMNGRSDKHFKVIRKENPLKGKE